VTLHDYIDIILFILSALFSIIGFLLIKHLEAVKQDVKQLYTMHHEDQANLTSLQIKLAENYPMKEELRRMATDIKDYFDERFKVVELLAKVINDKGL